MSVHAHPVPRAVPHAVRHLGWFAFVCLVAFLIPYLGVSVLGLQHDLYYLLYFAGTLALLAAYVRTEHVELGPIFRRRLLWSLGLGAAMAVVLVVNVFNAGHATGRPHGAYFAFELLWRGVGYGVVDTLLLTAFPCLVAYQLLHDHVDGFKRRLRFTALMLPLVIIVTATYHWGYPQYRQVMTVPVHPPARVKRPLLGLRRQPGRLALAVMRLPRPLYHRGWGGLLGHTFLLITHQGRTTGKRRETVAMALGYDRETREVVVCSAWGPNTEWMRNLRAHPALKIQIGRESYRPEQRFLSEDEAVAVGVDFRRRHPRRLRLFATVLGWGDLSSDEAVRELVRGRPFISFRPGDRVA